MQENPKEKKADEIIDLDRPLSAQDDTKLEESGPPDIPIEN